MFTIPIVGICRPHWEHIMQIEQDVPVELNDEEINEVAGGYVINQGGSAGVKG